VEQDDFERAEELEEERKKMEASVEEARSKLETIKAALKSCSGSDKISTTNVAEPPETSDHAVEETIPNAAPTPNGCQPEEEHGGEAAHDAPPEEEHDGEAAHDAPPSSQERQEAEDAPVAQPPPPPPPEV